MDLKQMSFVTQSTKVKINLSESHELVRIEKMIDWDILLELTMNIRASKIKSNAGRIPHLRELLGAVVLMALKKVTFREAEDLVNHYAPARYLCNLMDSEWSMDHVTIFDFTQMQCELL